MNHTEIINRWKVAVTFVHSGSAPDKPTGSIQSGWLNFASWLKSVAEYGADWQPAIKRLMPDFISRHPGSIGKVQDKLEIAVWDLG